MASKPLHMLNHILQKTYVLNFSLFPSVIIIYNTTKPLASLSPRIPLAYGPPSLEGHSQELTCTLYAGRVAECVTGMHLACNNTNRLGWDKWLYIASPLCTSHWVFTDEIDPIVIEKALELYLTDLFTELIFSDTYWFHWQYHTLHHYL